MTVTVLLATGLIGLGLLLPTGSADSTQRIEQEQDEERVYTRSSMEKVVVTEFSPAHDKMIGKTTTRVGHKVTLIGKHGLRLRVELPLGCQAIPIRARLGRIISVRADYWKVKGAGEQGELSRDDARLALCGDFEGRDVAQGAGKGRLTGTTRLSRRRT